MRGMFKTRKGLAIAATAAVAVIASAIGAFAYFTTTGTGTGTGTVGTSTGLVLHQDTITYSDVTDTALVPGTTATVTFKVDNPSGGNQQLGTISVSSITTDAGHTGCDTATNPTWFSTTTDPVNHDYAPGSNQAVTGSLTITFNNVAAPQDICKNAPLFFHYSA